MAARVRRRGRAFLEDEGGINLAPLLDVIFNLIFFFVVATTLRTDETFFDLVLPEAAEEPAREQQPPLPEVFVLQDGTLIYDGNEITADALEQTIREYVDREGTRRAVLSADGEASVQRQVDALEVLRRAGIQDVIQRVRTPP